MGSTMARMRVRVLSVSCHGWSGAAARNAKHGAIGRVVVLTKTRRQGRLSVTMWVSGATTERCSGPAASQKEQREKRKGHAMVKALWSTRRGRGILAAWAEARRGHARGRHASGRLFWTAVLAESVSEKCEVPSKSGSGIWLGRAADRPGLVRVTNRMLASVLSTDPSGTR